MARQEEGQEAEQENDRMGMRGRRRRMRWRRMRILLESFTGGGGIKGEEHKRGEKERCDYHFK